MGAAQGDRHAAHADREWIAPAEHPPVRDSDLYPLVDAKRAQPLRFIAGKASPIDRDDARGCIDGKKIECHREFAAAMSEV